MDALSGPSTQWLVTADGVKLFTQRWEPTGEPKGLCILVHGLGEHSGRYERLAQDLVAAGFAVRAMDHRGHGRSEGRRGDCRSIDQFLEDLHRFVETLRSPRVMIGHSLGGLIALYYACRYPQTIRAVAVSSPALALAQEPPIVKKALAHGLARILPATPIPNGVDPAVLSHDPKVMEQYVADPLVHRMITARCAVALQRAMLQAFELAPRIDLPCLILQAGSDSVCDAEATARFADQVKGAPMLFRRYEGMYHEIFNELDRDRPISDLIRWLKETIG